MGVLIDLTGKKFGRLTVVCLSSTANNRTKWSCVCDCGKEKVAEAYNLKSGTTSSCGCLRSENTARMKTKHGLRHHPLFDVWCHMKDRCNNAKVKAYKNYGARGIKVCDEWMNDAAAFINWALQNGWRQGLEIDREDNNSGYSPNNCRCVTPAVNSMNKRTTARFAFNGQLLNIQELEAICGINGRKIYKRVHVYNWPLLKAMELDKSADYHFNVSLKQEQITSQYSNTR